MSRYCTIPAILGLRKWYETRYGASCRLHDLDYTTPRIRDDGKRWTPRSVTRIKADRDYAKGMLDNHKWYDVPVMILTYSVIRSVGWMWYYWD